MPTSSLKRRYFHCAGLLLLIGVVLGFHSSAAADGVTGHWEGAFTRFGAVQQAAFDFWQTDSGLAGTYDIPDMILYREPVRELALVGDSLHLRVFWGGFDCLVNNEIGEITGENPKWNPTVSLHLKRSPAPRSFTINEVHIPCDSLTLVGDLLLPYGNPPFPAMVIVEGSSTGSRSLWTYRSVGDLFARNGIAALIYDKRGTGASSGDLAHASLDDLARDAASAFAYLWSRSEIDSSHVGIFGISQGGWIAPLVARHDPRVALVELLVGPAVSVWEQELQRVEYTMRAGFYAEDNPDEFTEEQIQAALAHTRLGFAVAQDPSRWAEWETACATARAAPWAAYVGLDSTLVDLQGWLRFRYDPSETLQHLRTPLLALFGGRDVFVPPSENVDLMRRYLTTAGNSDFETVVFPDVGHDMFTGATLIGGEWQWPSGYWRWNRRAPGLTDTIVTWTLRHVAR